MSAPDSPAVFVVFQTAHGWIVSETVRTHGPFVARQQAVHLAEGLATAIRYRGRPALVKVQPMRLKAAMKQWSRMWLAKAPRPHAPDGA